MTSSIPSRLLVTGACGQLGTEVVAAATAAGLTYAAHGSRELDITDVDAVTATVADFGRAADEAGQSAVLINAAAYTAVDAAESDRDAAYAVNATGPQNLARACAACGVRLIHVSTDYVFPGDGRRPYEIDDPTGPRSVYGASKLAGEQAVLASLAGAQVVRTAWVWGTTGANFVKTMAALAASRPTVDVVDDQRGSPTYAADLAAGLLELAGSDVPGGVLHATNAGETTWYEFARAIFAELGEDPARVHPTTSDKFPRPAPRPAYSVLSGAAWAAAGLTPLRPWRAALADAVARSADAFRTR